MTAPLLELTVWALKLPPSIFLLSLPFDWYSNYIQSLKAVLTLQLQPLSYFKHSFLTSSTLTALSASTSATTLIPLNASTHFLDYYYSTRSYITNWAFVITYVLLLVCLPLTSISWKLIKHNSVSVCKMPSVSLSWFLETPTAAGTSTEVIIRSLYFSRRLYVCLSVLWFSWHNKYNKHRLDSATLSNARKESSY